MTSPSHPPGELEALDALFQDRQAGWWDRFYADRDKPVPFFVNQPDACLAQWVSDGHVRPGRALDLGCGGGRNALFLAKAGFAVEGVDYAQAAIDWAAQRAAAEGVSIALHHASVFDMRFTPGSYDLVYDSGCFHHLAPHRRAPYVELVRRALRPGGLFGMTCFRPEGGSGLSDDEVYQCRSLGGGLGYTEAQLRSIWSPHLTMLSLKQMSAPSAGSPVFSAPFLWAMLARRDASLA